MEKAQEMATVKQVKTSREVITVLVDIVFDAISTYYIGDRTLSMVCRFMGFECIQELQYKRDHG